MNEQKFILELSKRDLLLLLKALTDRAAYSSSAELEDLIVRVAARLGAPQA